MNYEYYKVFYEVAMRKSLTQAAGALFVSQSAVSQTIAQMEQELGVPLFIRKPRGVQLTQEGQVLFEHVRDSVLSIRSGEEQVRRMISLRDGMLSIAASDTMSEQFLLPYLERFHRLYPDIRLHVNNKTSGDSIQSLLHGEVEMAFVNLPVSHRDIEVRPILKVHDIFVASPSVVKTLPSILTLEELASQRLIMLETLSNSRRYVDEFFLENGVALHPETELGAHRLVLEFARIGLGIGCIIREFSLGYLDSGALQQVFVSPPVPSRGIALCTLKGVPLSTSAEAYVRMMESLADSYLPDPAVPE